MRCPGYVESGPQHSYVVPIVSFLQIIFESLRTECIHLHRCNYNLENISFVCCLGGTICSVSGLIQLSSIAL